MVSSDVKKNVVSSETNEEEDLMNLVGGDGPWQRWIFVAIILCSVPDGCHNMAMTFYAPNIEHWCARPAYINMSVQEWKYKALPPDDQHCSRYKYFNLSNIHEDTNATKWKERIACDSWEYDRSVFRNTVLSEWNLVCDKEWLVSMTKSIFIAGYFLSAIVFGYLADRIGRKSVIIIANAISLIFSIVCAFSTSFIMFAVCRFFIAAGVTGVDNTSFVLLMEIIGPKFRTKYGMSTHFGWIIGYMSLPLLAWLLGDWFWMQLIITLPCILLLSTYWLLPESPRWLLAQGKEDAALEILSKAAKKNGMDLTERGTKLKETIYRTTKAHKNEDASVNVLQLFKRGLWKKSIIVFYLW
ncbi:organic cation transporter protein [Nephila pilipes]|uniref:Organic cation transporter protein n=1 Tax=Nephila pilipes TaxID=299642 RepID=A0A8X6PE71_NEPPI|nr:organic cation transporter protein [Nephila pilipes]